MKRDVVLVSLLQQSLVTLHVDVLRRNLLLLQLNVVDIGFHLDQDLLHPRYKRLQVFPVMPLRHPQNVNLLLQLPLLQT